jgi:predicted Zn-dependent protease with MMP-like domain
VVEGGSLENCYTGNRIVSSNLTPTASENFFMTPRKFENLVTSIGLSSVPKRFHSLITNVAFLIEDDVSKETRHDLDLAGDETLLGLYQGIPHTSRGDGYGSFGTMPDTITLFREPILQAAEDDGVSVRKIIEETIWHEVAHHFGLEEHQIAAIEKERGAKRQ